MSTTNAKNNLEYIGSALSSAILLITICTISASTFGYADLGAVPQSWLVTIVVPIVIMSAIQAFGDDVYRVFKTQQTK
jgi:uncharacterized membrane protein